jgi:2-(1,2-epoxy-1,2-dihydrophenyl)acetyl-CoA isomerase
METLIVERNDSGIVTVTLNRPERKNAINGPMWVELLAVFQSIGKEHDDRVLILTGAGGEFCSGADLTPGERSTRERHQLDRMHDVAEVAIALHQVAIPVIAKVDGVAVGAGCNMALGADLIVASERARFSEIFARRGLSIDFGGSWLLPRLVGIHKAKELALFADILSAREAEQLGIVNRVVPTEELDGFVDDWAARLAAGPPLALKMTKRLLNDALSSGFDQALEAEGMAQTVNFATRDTREAMLAFVEKRQPRFEGR